MKKTFFVISFLALVLLTNVVFTLTGCSSEQEVKTTDSVKISTKQIPNQYAIPPLDITVLSQAVADTFSWKTFIAMNWPANGNTCGPDTGNGISILNGTGPLVWETYLSSDQVFVGQGSAPSKWCEIGDLKKLPKKVQDLAKKTGVYRFVHRTSKAPHGLGQASGQPLVDQNGRFVRYEVRMNEDEYNYIMAKSLWNVDGQNAFVKDSAISFPAGPVAPYGTIGAMEFKAAWKVLGNGDDFSKFYTIKAIVFNDDSLNPSPGENPVTLGLVGLHIAHKTVTQGKWVWSTFEQVDNLTQSFNNYKCDTCAVNQPPSGGPNYKELDSKGNPLHKPTQVTRVNSVDSADQFVEKINTYFQSLLKGSVWANYQLVSTQWLFDETMTPLYLANSVQETYLQGPHPASWGGFKLKPGFDVQYFEDSRYRPFNAKTTSSSCMGCHYTATLPQNSKAKSDFSFLLGEAQLTAKKK
ncbi:MAG: hypothetical protein ACXVPN_00470 [Bacteroidia bacterium]